MKRLLFIFSALFLLFTLSSCSDKNADIIATNYVGYDFANNVIRGSSLKANMLLKPGSKIHGYQPSTTDMKAIINSKIFIYVGGESDEELVENSILPQIDKTKTIVLNMFDILNDNGGILYGEEDPETLEVEDEYDEHVWNDYDNALIILKEIAKAISNIDKDNKSLYEENLNKYVSEFNKEFGLIKELFNKVENPYILVADRFPLLYFTKYFDIDYDAALKGCSNSSDVSSNTLIRLKNIVEEKNIKYIFVIELSTKEIANDIKKLIDNDIKSGKYNGSNPKIVTIYTMHNISIDDFNSGLRFVDYMHKNYEVLNTYFN